MKYSHDGKSFDLLSNSFNQFLQEMYGDQSGECIWILGLKGLIHHKDLTLLPSAGTTIIL